MEGKVYIVRSLEDFSVNYCIVKLKEAMGKNAMAKLVHKARNDVSEKSCVLGKGKFEYKDFENRVKELCNCISVSPVSKEDEEFIKKANSEDIVYI